MTHFKRIYSQQAHQYQQLVAREDYQGNLPETLSQIRPFQGLEVVDMGAGTWPVDPAGCTSGQTYRHL